MKEIQLIYSSIKKDPTLLVLLIVFVITWGLVFYFKLADGLNEIGNAIGEALAK